MFEGLDEPTKSKVLHEMGLFAMTIIEEGLFVQAKCDANKNPLESEAPLVMPADIVKLPTRTFIKEVLDCFRGHINKHWSAENIEKLEDDHRELVNAVKNDGAIKKILDGHDEKTFFNDAWNAILSTKEDGTI